MAGIEDDAWRSHAGRRGRKAWPGAPRLPVEEPNELSPLAVGEASHRLRLADAGLVQETRRLYPTELGHGHQHVEHLRGRDVLGWVVEDPVDPSAPHFQILFELGAFHPDVVCALESFHALVARPGGRLRLSLRCRHGAGY